MHIIAGVGVSSRGRRSQIAAMAFAVAAALPAAPRVTLAHDDPPGNKMTDFATVTEVWTDKDWSDGFLFLPSDAEICVIAIFQHHGHDRSQITIKTKVGEQTVETVVPYFDISEKCNDDVSMTTSEPYYDPATMQWRLVGGPRNGITNAIPGARHDECTERAAWRINVQGWEHDEDQAEILKKIAKALTDAASLVPDVKWQAGSKVGATLAEFFAGLFTNDRIGEVTLDFPPGEDGPLTGSGAHLVDVSGEVRQEARDGGGPCSTPTTTATPVHTTPATPATGVPTPTTPGTIPTPTTPDTTVPTPTTPNTIQTTPVMSLAAGATRDTHPAAAALPSDCGADSGHPLGKRLTRTARLWTLLSEAAAELPKIGSDPQEHTPDPTFVRQVLAEAIGTIGSIVAGAEVEEAEGKVAPDLRAAAQALVVEGNGLRDQAAASGNAAPLLLALERYRTATDTLLPILHPECQLVADRSCQRTVVRASTQLAHSRVAALVHCETLKVRGTLPRTTDCRTEPKTVAHVAKASTAFRAAIDKACGGTDKQCGGDIDGESSPAALGFAARCPGITDGRCDGAIADCGTAAACLACIADAALDHVVTLAFASLQPSDPKKKAERALNKCQRTIGAALQTFLAAKAGALQRCWDARVTGKHAHTCPSPGDGKAAAAIAKAAAKRDAAICKACGGLDGKCGGADDLGPDAIGFAPDCHDVRIPDGRRCARPIGTLTDLVACVGCVSEFAVDCLDAARVPDFATYPAECRP